jgi:hypothetical protein
LIFSGWSSVMLALAARRLSPPSVAAVEAA